MIYTIGELAKKFAISRSSLLYYDKKGLLSPSSRSTANYRCYNESDYERLEKIMVYRQTGLSLNEILLLLQTGSESHRTDILTEQLSKINDEINALRIQQQVIIQMLGKTEITQGARFMNKQQWVDLLSSIGLSESEMMQWHVEFERRMPEAHQDFLESLNISAEEIKTIRSRSKT